MKATPVQKVKADFGGRAGLVTKILPLLGESQGEAKSKLMGASNKQLMRIFQVATSVQKRFGSRKDLIGKITALRYPGGKPADGYLKRLEDSTLKRLMDEYRQAGGK